MLQNINRRLNWGSVIDFLCNSRWECIEYMLKYSIKVYINKNE